MKNIIFYCHGFGSSKNTDKVTRLKTVGDVFAWDINIDPDKSLPDLYNQIENVLLSNKYIHSDIKITFVGTSLGGWYAARLAYTYDCECIIVNPVLDPFKSLIKYDVPVDIRVKYERLDTFITNKTKIIVSTLDTVLDHTELIAKYDVLQVAEGDHRFNGPEFEKYVVGSIS